MFEKLTDFSLQRSRKQAVGFYLAWLLAGIVATALILQIYLHVSGLIVLPKEKGFKAEFGAGLQSIQHMGRHAVPFIVLVFSVCLSFLIMRAKKLFRSRIAVACLLLAVLFSWEGAFLAFIPVAYLTTLPKGNT